MIAKYDDEGRELDKHVVTTRKRSPPLAWAKAGVMNKVTTPKRNDRPLAGAFLSARHI